MTEIEQKFGDITNIFSADGYTFLKIRAELEKFSNDANAGDQSAAQLVEVFNRFHRLCMILSK